MSHESITDAYNLTFQSISFNILKILINFTKIKG